MPGRTFDFRYFLSLDGINLTLDEIRSFANTWDEKFAHGVTISRFKFAIAEENGKTGLLITKSARCFEPKGLTTSDMKADAARYRNVAYRFFADLKKFAAEAA